ncbi:MAG TPA: Rne/Rng family ribonuclease, partial [Xanthomonadales bacterium]|nr:Rne/Rng family ribonuclease [Xanthomonadales bacterium]
IIDFIDMLDPEHRRQVLRTLERGLARDRARTTVHEFSPLGLVEMTRKRTTDSLARQLCAPCPTCAGRGLLRTAETVTYEIFREVTRAVRQFDA